MSTDRDGDAVQGRPFGRPGRLFGMGATPAARPASRPPARLPAPTAHPYSTRSAFCLLHFFSSIFMSYVSLCSPAMNSPVFRTAGQGQHVHDRRRHRDVHQRVPSQPVHPLPRDRRKLKPLPLFNLFIYSWWRFARMQHAGGRQSTSRSTSLLSLARARALSLASTLSLSLPGTGPELPAGREGDRVRPLRLHQRASGRRLRSLVDRGAAQVQGVHHRRVGLVLCRSEPGPERLLDVRAASTLPLFPCPSSRVRCCLHDDSYAFSTRALPCSASADCRFALAMGSILWRGNLKPLPRARAPGSVSTSRSRCCSSGSSS